MSGLIEQLGLLFGGGNLYDGPPMEAHSESNVPRERANVPPERARVPTYEQSQAEARASARVDSGTGRPQPKRNLTLDAAKAESARLNPPPKQGPPSRLANAAQHTTQTYVDSHGNKVPVPEGYEWDRKMNKLNKVVGKYVKPVAKIAGGAGSLGLQSALYSETLGVPEHQQEWIDAHEPEGFVASTVITRDELTGNQQKIDAKASDALANAKSKVELMREVGANPALLAEAEAELAALEDADPQQSITDYEAQVKADLAQNQAKIDMIMQEVGDNPELAKARLGQQGGFMNDIFSNFGNDGGILGEKARLEQKLVDAGLIRKQMDDKVKSETIAKDPQAQDVIKLASGMTTDQFRALRGTEKTDIEAAGEGFFGGFFDGFSFKKMFTAAGESLGEMWDDPAIRHALTFYIGSRMMGYTASGSGMAAGEILTDGWKAQGLVDSDTRKAKLKSQALDMSKTVKMFNPRTNQVIEGYAAPNGNFQEMGSDKTYAAKDLDYLTYDSSRHKTREEMSKELMTSTTDITNKTLANIRTQSIGDNPKYTSEQYKQVDDLFGDGTAARDVILQVTRDMNEAGVKTNTLAFRSAIEGTIQRQIRDVASGKYKGTEMVADLVGKVNEDMLKADLKGEGGIPAFIYGKATKWSKAGVENIEDGFEMPPVDSLRLHKKSTAITRDIIDHLVRNDLATPAKARHLVTKHKTIQELGAVFQEVVMQDPDNIKYWTRQANGAKTNAFSVWLDSAGEDSEQKYMGLNNPIALKKVNEFYKKLIKKDK
jgi:hypothetical protein